MMNIRTYKLIDFGDRVAIKTKKNSYKGYAKKLKQ